MPNLHLLVEVEECRGGKTFVQPNLYIIDILQPIIPSVREANVTQIHESTRLHRIPKTLHLSFRVWYTPELFPSIEHLIEVTRA